MSRVPPGYAILGKLGAGAFGSVFRAMQLNLSRVVALKILKPATEPRPVLRFQREARLLAGLAHPNVLKVYDFGFQGVGGYLATEIVPGGSLAARLQREGPLRATSAVALVTQVLDALECTHRHGVIHRDVKPANILDAGDGTARLADFGLAYITDATALTVRGAPVGTPHYMPPEAFVGGGHSTMVDVYAAAVTLFELLTGRAPTAGMELPAVLAAKQAGLARRGEAGTDVVPERLRAIIEKATAPRPEDRFCTATELAHALAEPRPRRTTRVTVALRVSTPSPWWRRWTRWFSGLVPTWPLRRSGTP